jgi:hypothetical protein
MAFSSAVENDMLALNGQLSRADGGKLVIVTPAPPPHPDEGTLFEPLIEQTDLASSAAQ